MHYILA